MPKLFRRSVKPAVVTSIFPELSMPNRSRQLFSGYKTQQAEFQAVGNLSLLPPESLIWLPGFEVEEANNVLLLVKLFLNPPLGAPPKVNVFVTDGKGVFFDPIERLARLLIPSLNETVKSSSYTQVSPHTVRSVRRDENVYEFEDMISSDGARRFDVISAAEEALAGKRVLRFSYRSETDGFFLTRRVRVRSVVDQGLDSRFVATLPGRSFRGKKLYRQYRVDRCESAVVESASASTLNRKLGVRITHRDYLPTPTIRLQIIEA